jgi:hypothetical protein
MHFDLHATAKLTSYAPRHNAPVFSGEEVVRRLRTLSNSATYGPGVSVLRLLSAPKHHLFVAQAATVHIHWASGMYP